MTFRKRLESVLTATDRLSVTDNGELMIDGCKASDLVAEHGSPLFVLSENTLRDNLRRVKAAFVGRWPQPVNVMFAIKANNNFAVRAICNEEGVGGDCFGAGEVEATYIGGADPKRVALNGTVKSEDAIRRAIQYGYSIHLDSYEEIEIIERITNELGATGVRIGVRLKVLPDTFFKGYDGDAYPVGDFLWAMNRMKFGLLKDTAIKIVKRVNDIPAFEFYGFQTHLGRFGKQLEGWEALYRQFAKDVIEISRACDVTPFMVDLGGGWPRERDPESRGYEQNPHQIEDYADVVCKGMRDEFEKVNFPIPQLWMEPGRYIAGNMGVLLSSVNVVKRDGDLTYTTCDASTYLAILVESHGSKNMVLPATKMDDDVTMKSDIVGPICVPSIWAGGAEAIEDLFATQILPERLKTDEARP